jgi:hypothetical protein
MEQALVICLVLLSGADISTLDESVSEQPVTCIPVSTHHMKVQVPYHLREFVNPDLLKPEVPPHSAPPAKQSHPRIPSIERSPRAVMVRM